MEFQEIPALPMAFEEPQESRDNIVLPPASYNTIQIFRILGAITDHLETGPIHAPTRNTLNKEGSKSFQRIPFPGTQDKQSPAAAIVFPPGLDPFPRQKDCVAGAFHKET